MATWCHRMFTGTSGSRSSGAEYLRSGDDWGAGRTVPVSRRDRRGRPRLSFDLDESKLDPPPDREGIVARTALVDHLVAADAAISARRRCAGGLRQDDVVGAVGRAQATAGGVAVSGRARQRPDRAPDLSRRDLGSRRADRAEGVSVTVFTRCRHRRHEGAWSRRSRRCTRRWPLSSTMPMHSPTVACRDIVAELALRLPAGSQLAIGSRGEVPVPVSLLRARARHHGARGRRPRDEWTGGTVAPRGRRCRVR